MTGRLTAAACAALVLALAGAAEAAPIRLPDVAVAAPTDASPLPVGYRPAGKPLPEGVARTAIDHRFDRDGAQDYVGAAGLLCGLKPGDDSRGAAAAFGRDEQGKFVGAKFSIAF